MKKIMVKMAGAFAALILGLSGCATTKADMTALCEETGFYQKVRTAKAAAEEAMDLADFLM